MRSHYNHPLVVLLLLCSTFVLMAPPGLGAVPPAYGATGASTPTSTVSAGEISAGRQAVESDASLDEAQKQKGLELYTQAEQSIAQTSEAHRQLAQLKTLIDGAPQRITAIRDAVKQPDRGMKNIEPALASDSLDDIEQAVAEEELALQKARDAQKRYADELARLLVGSKGVSEEIAQKLKSIDQLTADLRTAEAEKPGSLQTAKTLMLKNRQAQRRAELELLQFRLGNHEILTNLAQAERDFVAVEINERQARLDTLSKATERLRDSRATETRQAAEELKIRAQTLPPPLQSIAHEHARYLDEMEGLINREKTVSNTLQAARLRLDEIKVESELTRKQVEFVGPSEAIGTMLKRRRAELPSLKKYQRTSFQRAAEIEQITNRLIEIEELLRAERDTQAIISRTIDALSEEDRSEHGRQVADMVQARRDGLNQLQKAYSRYIGQVTSLDLTERQLVDVAESYVGYINDQLVWMPDPGFRALISPLLLGEGAIWLITPANWLLVAEDAWMAVRSNPLWTVALAALVALLLTRRGRARARIAKFAAKTHKIRTDAFALTLKTLFYTLVVIAGWPLLLVGAGLLLGSNPHSAQFTLAVAEGLLKSGIILAGIEFLIQINLPENLGDRHLRWDPAMREALVRALRWILPITVPLVFLITTTTSYEPNLAVHLVGRAAFIAMMVVTVLFAHRLLRSDGPFMRTLTGKQGGTLTQTHFLWFPLTLVVPLAFAASSAFGYHDAVVHLGHRGGQTFWFFLALFLVKELLLRFLYVAERRLRFEDAVRRREELRARRTQADEVGEDESSTISLEIPEINFDELGEQNKRLIKAGFLFAAIIGLWSIWGDLLPALTFLTETRLPIHSTTIVDGIAQEVALTLGDVVLGLVIAAITILASKNIPGVLEIALLQRLPLDPGGRYAITTLTQYAIAGIGILAAFSTLGLQWSNIQWLVAALGVGLGFGLQEIVANFISGIILLFERPIRIGDVVTIDNISGKVSRIQIRATTITNWDRQELLIPNKEFITGRVINWTLSDKVNRIIITVGVAYGSDVQRAMELMLEAACENANVLDEPEPQATFEAFGDNALTLLLRSYLGSMDYRLETITALHQAINRKFAAAGISIAFPQRDIHLDTEKPLDIRIHRPHKSPPGAAST